MGLLTDPNISTSSQKSKYAKQLIKYNRLLCFILFFAGLGWFFCLPDENFLSSTYFSENALLPGLVYSEIKTNAGNDARNLLADLERERETHRKGIPYSWVLGKMNRIGLETHTQNFTVNYPLGGGKIFKGKNIYGILRAPRIGSTEAIVITVPYRSPESIHTQITSGVPLILAFAEFAKKQKYWAKDIIFLITDQEQLGMQAWLEAYYGYDDNPVLKSGSLEARAGQIQAAINLEVQDFDVDFINLKLEGLNGQLPNLDLHNLAQKLSHKHGISTGYKLKSSQKRRGKSYEERLENLVSMVLTQASGVPTGNHGIFHKYGIQALTLECYKTESTNFQRSQAGALALLKIVEGITRSLNNLLERFHQSFFFYLILSSDRFVSIGDYMPCIGLMAGSLLIKAFIIWLSINQDAQNEDEVEKKTTKSKNEKNFDFMNVGFLFIIAHFVGVLTAYLPLNPYVDGYLHDNQIPTQIGLFSVFVTLTVLMLPLPIFWNLNQLGNDVLQIVVLLELGTALISVSMLNFSLGFILCLIIVPFALLVRPNVDLQAVPTKLSRFNKHLARFLCFLLHPLSAICLVVLAITFSTFPEMALMELVKRAFTATMDAITFSVVDSLIYGNWLYDVVTLIFLPSWILFWFVLFPKTESCTKTLKCN